ncbi:hypothetical protein T492DRAFT_864548 [Pavlovales sp. CCMP2436]|nr:hypothetical protein T492DRAFT_864548 [Pavlovales sp. CCMP2436]
MRSHSLSKLIAAAIAEADPDNLHYLGGGEVTLFHAEGGWVGASAACPCLLDTSSQTLQSAMLWSWGAEQDPGAGVGHDGSSPAAEVSGTTGQSGGPVVAEGGDSADPHRCGSPESPFARASSAPLLLTVLVRCSEAWLRRTLLPLERFSLRPDEAKVRARQLASVCCVLTARDVKEGEVFNEAAAQFDVPTMRLLLANGADADGGDTGAPLDVALQNANESCVAFLLGAGATPSLHGLIELVEQGLPDVDETGRAHFHKQLVACCQLLVRAGATACERILETLVADATSLFLAGDLLAGEALRYDLRLLRLCASVCAVPPSDLECVLAGLDERDMEAGAALACAQLLVACGAERRVRNGNNFDETYLRLAFDVEEDDDEVQPGSPFAEALPTCQWLRATAGYSMRLHYCQWLPPFLALDELLGGADVHAVGVGGAPSPFELATALERRGEAPRCSSAWLVLHGHSAWAPGSWPAGTADLFPREAAGMGVRTTFLLWLGAQLGARLASDDLHDLWAAHVLPHIYTSVKEAWAKLGAGGMPL